MARQIKGTLFQRGEVWYYRFKYNKKQVYKAGTKDKDETEAMMHNAIAECRKTEKIFNPSKNSLINLINDWYTTDGILGLRYGTRQDYSHAINRIKSSAIANMKISTITTADLQFYFDTLKGKYAPSTVKADRAVLNSTFRYAIHRSMIKSNPMSDVSFKSQKSAKKTFLDLAETSAPKKILSDDEISKIIDIIKDSIYYVPFMIGYYTGMREGEVTALSWDCIDFNTGTIHVIKNLYYDTEFHRWELGPPKSGKARTITIGQSLMDILHAERKRQLQQCTDYNDIYPVYYYTLEETADAMHVYVNQNPIHSTPIDFVCRKSGGELITTGTLKYLAKHLQKDHGIHFTFHMLRHTHATLLIENGANMKDVQTRLGHSTYQITADTYSHVTKKMNHDTAELFEKISCTH